ncbi:MAG TPA: hypothetical protein VN864_04805 [Thermoplasmata archaeon]|nr:hypothetical protein [Thermoplasmata archaeon]
MIGADRAEGVTTGAPPAAALPAVPSPLGRKLLAFEFLVLVEYWLGPLFLGVTNYAGVWSDVGLVLFAMFVGTLIAFVLVPLRPHLRQALASRADRIAFHGVWAAAFVAGLFVTNTFQVGGVEAASGVAVLGSTTVYTPFGAWPSLTVYVPGLRLFGTLNLEILAVLGLVAVLGSSALRLGTHRAALACPVDAPKPGTWSKRLASVAVWTPLGLITGCTACAPLYLTAIGWAAPAVAAGGLSAVPLVPWIGFAGLLYLFSFGLSITLIHRATRPLEDDGPSVREVAPGE